MKLRDYPSAQVRREALEKETGVSLKNIGIYSLDEDVASTRNCQNMIGVVQVPMGMAGPLRFRTQNPELNDQQKREYYIPLATTEGALIASVNRGCKAIAQSGGALVDTYRVGATRGPVFRVKNLKENDLLNTFLESHFPQLQSIAKKTSSHLTLNNYFSRGLGKQRYVRFVFDTADAMGMNMATIATNKLVAFIEEKTGAVCVSIAGNYDVDKKPSWLNIIEGRGFKAWAEATLPLSVLTNTLKTSAQSMYDVWLIKCMLGSAMSGSVAFNAQFANVVAAIFLATGQDIAHVAEGSLGITTTEIVENTPDMGKNSHIGSQRTEGLYVSVYLPDLMVGTVGGGTGLATQKEALTLLGVAGGNEGKNAQRFAEIVAAAVLAGEISLLASLAEGSLARAHQRLARGEARSTA